MPHSMSESAFDAVLFDMDGVLIDTHMAVTRFWMQLADRTGVSLTSDDFVQHIYGRKAEHTLAQFFPKISETTWQQAVADLVAEEAVMQHKPIPGVIALLQALNKVRIPVALVTSAMPPKVAIVCEQLGLDQTFQAVVTARDIDQGKPHPDCYQLAAKRLGKPVNRCIVFEDSLSGAEAALAAGATCIGVNRASEQLLQLGVALVIPDFTGVAVETDARGMRLRLLPQVSLTFD